ncbi:hypothetical protein CCMA1212_002481 [Trichoderma ghanense]|uniref:Uncharacterized protein n=1 Tax=Trichoderma ghanense TaxID=65468 RepID=A0ABY2HCZ0_9HYPO
MLIHVPCLDSGRPRLHLDPLAVRRPDARLGVVPARAPQHVRKAKVLGQPQGGVPRPDEAVPPVNDVVKVPPEALDVVDEDADAVVDVARRLVPRKGNVGRAVRALPQVDDGLRDGREERALLRVSLEGDRRLQHGIEAPARDAVDEQPDQEALVEQRRSGLQARARQQQERQDVVVDAQLEPRERQGDDDAEDEERVQLNVLDEPPLLSEEKDLRQADEEEDDDDGGQGSSGAGLLVEVVLVEALDGDKVQRVVGEGAHPAGAQPEDRLLDLGRQVVERAADAHLVVHDPGAEHGRHELAEDVGEEVRHRRVAWLVERHADGPEDAGKGREEEEGGRGGAERQHAGEDGGQGQDGPSLVPGPALDVGHEAERQREVRVEADAEDAVPLGADKVLLLPDELDDAAAALFVGEEARVDGRGADVRVAAVRGQLGLDVARGPADDERPVDDLLVADGARVQHMVALARGRALEGEAAAVEGPAVVAVEPAAVAGAPVRVAAADGLRLAPALDGRLDRLLALDQHKRDEPEREVEEQRPGAVGLGQEAVDEHQRILLHGREQRLDAVRLRVGRPARPFGKGQQHAADGVRDPAPALGRALVLDEARRGRIAVAAAAVVVDDLERCRCRWCHCWRCLERRIGVVNLGDGVSRGVDEAVAGRSSAGLVVSLGVVLHEWLAFIVVWLERSHHGWGGGKKKKKKKRKADLFVFADQKVNPNAKRKSRG